MGTKQTTIKNECATKDVDSVSMGDIQNAGVCVCVYRRNAECNWIKEQEIDDEKKQNE